VLGTMLIACALYGALLFSIGPSAMFFGDEGKGWALFLIWVSSTFGGNVDICIGCSVVSIVCVRALWELPSFGCFRLFAARVLFSCVASGPPAVLCRPCSPS
jgi:hypothetical protein